VVPLGRTMRLLVEMSKNKFHFADVLLFDKCDHDAMAYEPGYKEFVEKLYDKYCPGG
jgi:hypothetical protein